MISITTTKVFYDGDGATLVYGYPFRVDDASYVKAYVDGVLKVYSTDFGVANVGSDIGGSITFVVAPPSGTSNVVIYRDTPETQIAQLGEGGVAYENLERQGLDKLVMLIQERLEQLTRAPKIPVYTNLADLVLPAPGAGQLWGWNAAGTAPALYSLQAFSGITFFSTSVIAGATSGTFTHNLGSATAKLVSPIATWNSGAFYHAAAQGLNTFSLAWQTAPGVGGGTVTWGAIL